MNPRSNVVASDASAAAPSLDPPVVPLVTRLFSELEQAGVEYCHWKSNDKLDRALRGEGDLDVLVARDSRDRFLETLARLGFRVATARSWETHPAIRHYFGLDDTSGRIVHLHVYYRLNTGGALVKGYRLPLEEMLLANLRRLDNVPVPTKAAELLALITRKMLEFGTITEIPFMHKEYPHVIEELRWLDDADVVAQAVDLWRQWMPFADVRLFEKSVAMLKSGQSHFRLFRIGRQFHKSLRSFATLTPTRRFAAGAYRFGRFVSRRLMRGGKTIGFATGGAMVAFIGGDGSGKSTLLAETGRCLDPYLGVEVVHAGKPPSTLLTAIPNAVLPLMRRCFPRTRTNAVEYAIVTASDPSAEGRRRSLLYVIRSLFIAYDQWKLLTRCFRKAYQGRIVLCDRYPSRNLGGTDGPRVDPAWFRGRFSLRRLLARVEQRLYATIPVPDLVVFVTVPADVAVSRNVARDKKGPRESDEMIRFRHAHIQNWKMPEARVVRIDASGNFDDTLRDVKRVVWHVL